MQDSLVDTMQRPSWAISSAVLLIAALTLGLTTWYLWTGIPITVIHLLIAGVVVLAPLLVRWPLSTQRALKIALIWAVAGSFPGMFIFGVCVFIAAPVLAGSALFVHVLERHQPAWCSRTRGSADFALR